MRVLAPRFRWILVLEALLAGIYTSLTRGLFVVYLVSVGYAVEGISLVVMASSASSTLLGVFLYRRPTFIMRRSKIKLILFHAFERITWILISLVNHTLFISILYSAYMISSSLISILIAFTIYGSLDEEGIRDVTGKRSAASGVSSVLGYALGALLLALLPADEKFSYIFPLGSLIGLVSTLLISLLDLSHLEEMSIPVGVEQPERIFSTSSFFMIFLASGNFGGIIWTPYVMNRLGGPAFIPALMSLFGSISSITASLFWKARSFTILRVGLLLNALGPLVIWMTPHPALHILINIYTSFTYTAGNFIGSFLFARYKEWFGAVKSSVLLGLIGSIAQLVASPLGMLIGENYLQGFTVMFALKALANLLAFLTIPEVAIVPEEVARTYSRILYSSSLTGYQFAFEVSKETILVTLKLITFSMVIIALYIIYRVLWILMT
ncbi:hypothetical protein KEJ49_01770 [Candidatus Bathyarchaeota archaeon]|nr:hypothetical protein [Candidatus Bathyarchaeota archaeon]